MTTTTERRPSPADMPSRPAYDPLRPVRAEELDVPFRAMFERALLQSTMHPHTRLVGLALATHCDALGLIPEADQPRLHGLTSETGLHLPQVVVALNTLLSRGLISRRMAVKWERAEVQLVIPHAVLARLSKAQE
ncbi:hypothetical protein E3E14_25180 [Streptomyces sp. ICN441]|uniref:hypothetical protein n=1 Tax=Streptomyces sp. ICN441 TaxID=2558286 RepID=UPI00106DB09B|nr:hypothetical protein [Streptomyces sp. ICN441]TFE42480.1 hypothetical protein E3E14_25180 [Streptomyces sp. ICN441]